MLILSAILCGFLLDLLFADRFVFPHPVVLMGKCVSAAERFLRSRLPRTPRGEWLGGVILAASLPLAALTVTGGLCRFAARVHPLLYFTLETLWSWQALSLRGLADAGRRVYEALPPENSSDRSGRRAFPAAPDLSTKRDLSAAREAVSRIVGRDTETLDAAGVIRAAVESIAENFCDGVAAPLCYLFLGGAPLAMAYKAVNTMDSMIGYQNDRYLYFGRAAAKLDDAANYLPARFAALCWIAAAALTGQDAAGAFRVWRRDRRKHASPNAAQTESACAGALGVRLGGPARYGGRLHEKPYLGDHPRPIEAADILRANRMLYAGSLLLLAALSIIYLALYAIVCRV